jgi:hypothetical protein
MDRSKIIEPSREFIADFKDYVLKTYREEPFSIAEAANRFFQYRYSTSDKWTDPKNITGWIKRESEAGGDFEFVETKASRSTGKQSKHYKVTDRVLKFDIASYKGNEELMWNIELAWDEVAAISYALHELKSSESIANEETQHFLEQLATKIDYFF